MALQWEKIAPLIAVDILGQPTKKDATHLRWGNKGSLALDLENGTFYDFEGGEGYGLIAFLESKGLDVDAILAPYKDEPINTHNISPVTISEVQIKKPTKTFSDKQMFDLKEQSEIFVRYSDSFCVMRFPVDHYIKQKYAPFSKLGDSWSMCRPEGQLPIYCTNKNPEGYVVINEGEKASIGCESIVQDKADVCCWHGGVNAINKQDWSPLTNRKVIIFPDNDEAGKKVAQELKELLEPMTKECIVVKPPRAFKSKDDLYDAKINDFFKSPEEFIDYCLSNTVKKRVSFGLVQVNEIIRDIRPPDWLIKDICERDSVISVFGQAKSGKSFVTVDMAANVALGREYYGHETKQSAVVYLAGEGQRGIARRLSAWQTLNEQMIADAPLLISTRGARLLDEKDHQLLKDTVNQAEDQHGEVGLIIIDTLQRNFGQGNENSTEDMSAFIERIDDLRDTYSACICLVHHTGHGTGNRARGSSVIQASVDWEYKVERSNFADDMYVKFSQTLVKDGMPMKEKNFKFVEQKLPFVDDMTSGGLQLIDEEDLPKETSINGTDQRIIDHIRAIQTESSDPDNTWLKSREIKKFLTDIPDSTVQGHLIKLKQHDILRHDEKKGYQTKDLDNVTF